MWSGCAFSLPTPKTRLSPNTFPITNDTWKNDPKWIAFQPYLQELIETVQIQWERILVESRLSPPTGTSAKVVFQMTMDGKISNIIKVEGTANEQAKKGCLAAITARSPYSRWTPAMVAALGQSQELTFTFFYE